MDHGSVAGDSHVTETWKIRRRANSGMERLCIGRGGAGEDMVDGFRSVGVHALGNLSPSSADVNAVTCKNMSTPRVMSSVSLLGTRRSQRAVAGDGKQVFRRRWGHAFSGVLRVRPPYTLSTADETSPSGFFGEGGGGGGSSSSAKLNVYRPWHVYQSPAPGHVWHDPPHNYGVNAAWCSVWLNPYCTKYLTVSRPSGMAYVRQITLCLLSVILKGFDDMPDDVQLILIVRDSLFGIPCGIEPLRMFAAVLRYLVDLMEDSIELEGDFPRDMPQAT